MFRFSDLCCSSKSKATFNKKKITKENFFNGNLLRRKKILDLDILQQCATFTKEQFASEETLRSEKCTPTHIQQSPREY